MLLQALNLHKQYDDLPVLRGVNVDIREGEFVAIIGQSGSGKTTLLHSLSGLTPIDRGDIFIGEHRITSKDAFSRRKRRRDAITRPAPSGGHFSAANPRSIRR